MVVPSTDRRHSSAVAQRLQGRMLSADRTRSLSRWNVMVPFGALAQHEFWVPDGAHFRHVEAFDFGVGRYAVSHGDLDELKNV